MDVSYEVMLAHLIDWIMLHPGAVSIPANICTADQLADLLRAHVELTSDMLVKVMG